MQEGLVIKEKKFAIKDWTPDDQPRERLLNKGAQALSDSELLAILIRTGSPNSNALELARKVLDISQGNLSELARQSVREFMKIKGIGKAKAIAIAAALELGRRRQSSMSRPRKAVKDSREVAEYLRPLLADYGHEVFGVLYLNQPGRIKQFEIISQGGITGAIVDSRLIFKKALVMEAVSLIVCHNHPSGTLQPSKADLALTIKLYDGAKLLDLKLLDHIIVGEKGYFSFADEGLLKN